jgi:hypothetical protein
VKLNKILINKDFILLMARLDQAESSDANCMASMLVPPTIPLIWVSQGRSWFGRMQEQRINRNNPQDVAGHLRMRLITRMVITTD